MAAWAGTTLTAASTWLELALPERRPEACLPWDGNGPDIGAYPSATSAALVQALTDHTSDPGDVWAGWREGWGDLAVTSDVPRLHHPARAYALRHGTLTGTSRIAGDPPWLSRPPNLWWPTDRSWCVATEIDADCTYIGGSASLVTSLLAHPDLEAAQVDPAASSPALTSPAWLAEVLTHAQTRLHDSGTAVLELSRGAITANLSIRRRGRAGELTTSSVDDRGGRRGSTSTLRASEADLDTQVSAALLWAVYELTI
ncbi:hypothetical protein ACXR2U_13145 [Jatrophihabitans sp. YIM 134969]